jgi:hypothetical protein
MVSKLSQERESEKIEKQRENKKGEDYSTFTFLLQEISPVFNAARTALRIC